MAVYTLFGQQATGSGIVADASAYTMGVQFSVSQSGCTLTAIWFYSASGAVSIPGTIALYAVSGASLVHSEFIGTSWATPGSGWIRGVFASPPSLTASTSYKACVLQTSAANWYSATSHYWDSGSGSGGITSGPLSAPNNAGADHGQDSFSSGSTLTYPATSFNAANYWVDPEVTAPAPVLVPPLVSQHSGLY
jgi:Domain of unknown function (DUF4082)